jgi:hypothetical protein
VKNQIERIRALVRARSRWLFLTLAVVIASTTVAGAWMWRARAGSQPVVSYSELTAARGVPAGARIVG